MSISKRYLPILFLLALAGQASAQGMVCDVDADGDVDQVDIGLILAARNTPASGPDDPRDADGDGFITVLDARACVLLCTLPGCAEPPANTPPVADAGPDQTVNVGDTVTLDGSGSFDADGDPITFMWDLDDTPPGSTAALSDPTAITPIFDADVGGTYIATLIVNDGTDDSAPDETVVVTAPQNTAPVADAGPDQTALVGDTVTLDGSGSTDVDGDPLTFAWNLAQRPAGSAAALSDLTAVMPTFVIDLPGTYVVELVVDDGLAGSFPDSVTITTLNSPPVADAGPDQTVNLFDTVFLDGTGSFDPDGDALTYRWDLASVPPGSLAQIADPDAPQTDFFADIPIGQYLVRLVVSDGLVESAPDTVLISTSNTRPVAVPGPNQTAQVGDTVQLDGSASFDDDGDPLTYDWSFTTVPAGSAAALNDPTAVAPTFVADLPGTYVIQLIVNDGRLDSFPETTMVTVEVAPNNAPVLDPIANQTVDEEATLTVAATATDPDTGDILTFSLGTGAPTGAAIDPDTGVFTWTPEEADGPGTFPITVIVTDDGTPALDDIETFIIGVDEVNQNPLVSPIPNQTVDEQATLTVPVTATDDDIPANDLTFSLGTGAPAGAAIDPDTGVFTWTPEEADGPGTFPITVILTDDGTPALDDIETFIIGVDEVNQPPVLAPIGNRTVQTETPLTFVAVATDPDLPPNALAFSLDVGAPAGASIDPLTGQFLWTPNAAQGTGDFALTVRVTDDGTPSLDDSETINITVTEEPNTPPAVDAGPDATVDEGESFDSAGSFTDPDADTWTATVDYGAGAGLQTLPLNPDGTFTLNNVYADNGTFVVTVTVTDDSGGVGSDTAIVTVNNVAPDVDAGPDATIDAGDAFLSAGSFTDPGADTFTATVDYGEGAGPQPLTLDANNTFALDNVYEDAGTYVVTVTVTDDDGGVGTDTALVTVNAVNVAPELAAIGNQTIDENLALIFTAIATDDDVGDTLTFSLDTGAPVGATIDPTSGLFEWTPAEADGPNDFTVTVRVTDDGTPNLDDSETITITVNEVNAAPQFDPIGTQTVDEEDTLTFTITATDDDQPANALTFSLGTGAPAGAAIDPDTGVFTWTPEEADGPGTFPVTVIVTDDGTPALDDIETFIIGVDEVNQAPVLAAIGNQTVDELADLTFTAAATDDDIPANTLTFSLDAGAPAGATIDPTSGLFDWTPTEDDGGNDFTVTVRVTDDGAPALDDSETITITVNDVNAAPTADAGPDQTAITTDVVQLDGSGSSDPDGDPLTFDWSVASGPAGSAVNFSDATAESPTATFSDPGTYVLQLIVSDASQASAPDTVTIVVDPAPTIAIDNPAPVLEGDAGTTPVTFTVTLSAAVNRVVTVDFATADSTATAGDDYAANSGIVTFPANSTAPQTITVDIIGDTDVEPNEFFFVNLSNPVNATIADGQGVGTIQNDDAAATLSLTPVTLNLNTGDVGGLLLTLSTPAGPGGQVVDLASSDTAVATVPANVTILEGNTQVAFNVDAGNTAGTATITASAAGFASDTSIVNVASRALTIALADALVGIGRTIGGTVTLAQPAGVGGVTVTLTSANDAVATIAPAQITIPAGQTVGTFQVTGIAVGDALLTAAAPGFDPDSVNVTVTSNLINFGIVPDTAPGQSVGLPVSISSPAAGDLTINFVSSDTSIATVTPSIVIPNGAQIPAVNPQVTGVNLGTVTITGTAAGFAPDTQDVNVTIVLNFTPTTFDVVETTTENITLGLSAPAPVGGLTVPLATGDPSIATVPTDITIPAGQTTGQVPVTGVAQGSTTLTTNVPGATQAAATVNVTPAPSISIINDIIGNNLQIVRAGTLGAPAPAGGITVTLTSNDPARLLLADDPTLAGGTTITRFVNAGSTFVGNFYVQALDDTGTATYTASAPGYASTDVTVTFEPSGFDINFPTLINTNTLAGNTNVQVCAWRLNPATLARQASQNVRGGLTANVPVDSSDTNVGVITTSPLPIGPNDNCENTQFDPLNAGMSTISITQPAGFTTPNARQSIVADVSAPDVQLPNNTIVGEDLQVAVNVSLESAPPGPVNVTVTVAQPGLAIVSNDADTVGGASTTFVGVTGTNVGTLYVQGLAQGIATVTASAPGYTSDTMQVDIQPSGFDINSPTAINTTTLALNTNVQICAWRLNPANNSRAQSQSVRAGLTVQVPVTSSDTNVGVITTSPLPIGPNDNCENTQFDPLNPGTSTIAITQPADFDTPAARQSITATVTAPDVIMAAQTIVGEDLQTNIGLSLQNAPPAPVDVTVTINDPNVAIVSDNAAVAGGNQVVFPGIAGTFVGTFYVQGLVSGTTMVTASAPGYDTATLDVTVDPSGFDINSPGSDFTTNTFATNTTVQVCAWRLSPATLARQASQNVRGGLTVNVPVTSSDTNVGVITQSPLPIGPNDNCESTQFDPISNGTTTIAIQQPAGFETPSARQSILATVDAPDINLGTPVRVGSDLQVARNVSLESAPPGPVDVTITSSDAGTVTVTDDPNAAGGGSVTFFGATTTFVGTVYIQGRNIAGAQVTAQAAGYNDDTITVDVDPSGFDINSPSGNFTTTAAAGNTNIQVCAWRLDATFLNRQQSQNVRGGLTANVPVLSSDTNVGVITTSPLPIGPNDNCENTQFDPMNPGTTTISITAPGGFETPSQRQSIIGTVDP